MVLLLYLLALLNAILHIILNIANFSTCKQNNNFYISYYIRFFYFLIISELIDTFLLIYSKTIGSRAKGLIKLKDLEKELDSKFLFLLLCIITQFIKLMQRPMIPFQVGIDYILSIITNTNHRLVDELHTKELVLGCGLPIE